MQLQLKVRNKKKVMRVLAIIMSHINFNLYRFCKVYHNFKLYNPVSDYKTTNSACEMIVNVKRKLLLI